MSSLNSEGINSINNENELNNLTNNFKIPPNLFSKVMYGCALKIIVISLSGYAKAMFSQI